MPEEQEPSPLEDALRHFDYLFGKDQQVRNVEFRPESCPGLVGLIQSWLPKKTEILIDQDVLDGVVRHALQYGASSDEQQGLRPTTASGRRREADRVGVRSYLYISEQSGESGTPARAEDRIALWESNQAESPKMVSKVLRGRWASTEAKRFNENDPLVPVLSERSGNDSRDQYFRRLIEDFNEFAGDKTAVQNYVREIMERSVESTGAIDGPLELTVRIPRRVIDFAIPLISLAFAAGVIVLAVFLITSQNVDVRLRPALSETAAPTPEPSGWEVGWGPAREFYDGHKDNAAPAFNNLVSSDIGDERNFVQLRNLQDDTPEGWSDNVWAEPGQAYVMRIFITDSATSGKSGEEQTRRSINDVRLAIGMSNRQDGVDVFAVLNASNTGDVYDGASIHAVPGVKIKFDESTLRIRKTTLSLGFEGIESDVFSHSGGLLLDNASSLNPGDTLIVEVTVRATS